MEGVKEGGTSIEINCMYRTRAKNKMETRIYFPV